MKTIQSLSELLQLAKISNYFLLISLTSPRLFHYLALILSQRQLNRLAVVHDSC